MTHSVLEGLVEWKSRKGGKKEEDTESQGENKKPYESGMKKEKEKKNLEKNMSSSS